MGMVRSSWTPLDIVRMISCLHVERERGASKGDTQSFGWSNGKDAAEKGTVRGEQV